MLNPKKYLAEAKKVIKWDKDIFSVIFKLSDRVNFKPGQFLHLTLDEYNPSSGYWPESRVFSIASEPNKDEVEIIYSVKGSYTKRISEELYEGKMVWLKLPYGDFIIENYIKDCEKVFFIAGGTGISPFISYLRSSGCESKVDITLYYGIRSNNLYFYKDIIERSNINRNIIIGNMNIDEITNDISKINNSKTFISGPPLMINSFKKMLIEKGYNSHKIIIDEWE